MFFEFLVDSLLSNNVVAISLCQRYISSEAQAPSCVTGVLGATHVEIEHHLEMGRKLLAAGQLAEALSHYHSAVGKVTRAHTHTHADTHLYSHHWLTFTAAFSALIMPVIFQTSTQTDLYLYIKNDIWCESFSQRETLRIT